MMKYTLAAMTESASPTQGIQEPLVICVSVDIVSLLRQWVA
jgi:hypothetical protein